MKERKSTQKPMLKIFSIVLLLLVVIGIGIYTSFNWGNTYLQNLLTGKVDNIKAPVASPVPSAAPAPVPSPTSLTQASGQSLDKLVEEAVQNIKKGSASKPAVSPDKKRIAYVSPFDWEVIGEVHLYDVENKKDTVVVNSSHIKSQYTPKDVEWLDDRYLLVVVGFGYGTVTVGGDLYVLDTRDNKLSLAVTAGERREFKDIYMEKGVLMLDTAIFNVDMTNYTLEKKKLTPEEILAAIKK